MTQIHQFLHYRAALTILCDARVLRLRELFSTSLAGAFLGGVLVLWLVLDVVYGLATVAVLMVLYDEGRGGVRRLRGDRGVDRLTGVVLEDLVG